MPSDPKKTAPGKVELENAPKGTIPFDADFRNPLDLKRN
jgi:hypothetical protein